MNSTEDEQVPQIETREADRPKTLPLNLNLWFNLAWIAGAALWLAVIFMSRDSRKDVSTGELLEAFARATLMGFYVAAFFSVAINLKQRYSIKNCPAIWLPFALGFSVLVYLAARAVEGMFASYNAPAHVAIAMALCVPICSRRTSLGFKVTCAVMITAILGPLIAFSSWVYWMDVSVLWTMMAIGVLYFVWDAVKGLQQKDLSRRNQLHWISLVAWAVFPFVQFQ